MSKYLNLAIEFAGLLVPNPFILAAGPATSSGEKILRAFQTGWGGAVTKTIHDDSMPMLDIRPRFASLKNSSQEIIGFQNCELYSTKSVDDWIKDIRLVKRNFPDRLLIASIAAVHQKEAWQYLAMAIVRAGVDAIELNFSAINTIADQGSGILIGQDEELTRTVTGWVREAITIPLIVKLTPDVSNIVSIGQAAKDGGADILTAINTLQCLMGVNLDNLKPLPDINGQSIYGGYSGAAIRPLGLKAVAQLKTSCDMPIMGVGGIQNWQNAAEYIALGASVVQIGTASMLNGYTMIDVLQEGLSNYLASKEFDSLKDLNGIALSRMTTHNELDQTQGEVQVDQEKCVGCCRCLIACCDGACNALSLDHRIGKIVISEKCYGCGLCIEVCPNKVFYFEKNLCEITYK